MIKDMIVLALLSFLYAKWSHAEITEIELSDGTIVRSTTTRITNADHQGNPDGGQRHEGMGNYLTHDRIEPIIFVNPPAGSRPKSGHAHNSGDAYPQSPDRAPYIEPSYNNELAPVMGPDP